MQIEFIDIFYADNRITPFADLSASGQLTFDYYNV